MAAVNFFVGGYYLIFYLKRPRIREYLPFALLCLSVALYDAFSAGLYNSLSISDGIFWQRLQLDIGVAIALSMLWFTGILTEQKGNRIIQFLMAWFALILLASLFASPSLTLSPAQPAIKNVELLHLAKITYYEGAIGIVYQVEAISNILAYAYLVYLFTLYYRKTHYKTLFIILSCQFFYFIGVVNDSLVAIQAYSFIYISEYAFFFIVLSMAYMLLDKFADLQADYEELTVNLEQKVDERTGEIVKLNEELKRLAERDDLTDIYNRRFFNEYLEIEIKRSRSYLQHKSELMASEGNEMNFGLALLDIDHFKHINDRYGHLAGDNVLKQVTDIMEGNIFSRDVLCRYGGDEFVLLLTKTSGNGILQAVEKIRKEVEEHTFQIDKNHQMQHLTISAGVVNFDEVPDKRSEEILKLADDRLLKAKSLGRNRIVHAGNS